MIKQCCKNSKWDVVAPQPSTLLSPVLVSTRHSSCFPALHPVAAARTVAA